MGVWIIDPQYGGIKVPVDIHKKIIEQVNNYAAKQAWYPKFKLELRFKSEFCYLDASEEGDKALPIGRLRYFGPDKWSLAFYTYSNERYQPCLFNNGDWYGTIEQAIDTCAVYLI
jgi:hypothetical protein